MTCTHFAPIDGRNPVCLIGRLPEIDCHTCPAYQPGVPIPRAVWTDEQREQFRQMRSQADATD